MRNLAISVSVMAGIFGLSEGFCADKDSSAELVAQFCTSQCHTVERVKARTKTKSGWEKTVERMLQKMAEKDKSLNISQEDAKKITESLYQQYGYKDAKTGTTKAEERKKAARDTFPASEATTVSPKAKTVK